MKIAIIGGHPTPAFAVIEELPKEAKVFFIGRKYMMEKDTTPSFEYTVVTEKGIPFIPLTTGRLQRKLTSRTIPSLLKLPAGFMQAMAILKEHKPDVVIGFGGYVSVPVCMAAYILGIPFIIHEQTLEAGLANKLLAQFASRICISWQQSAVFFPKEKIVLTGNPVRKFGHPEFSSGSHKASSEMLKLIQHDNTSLPLIYITGGSTGSHPINVLIEGCLEQLLERYRVVHQTGDAKEFGDYDRLVKLHQTLPQKLQKRYVCTKFVSPETVGMYIQKSDLVISRAGMNTVTELLHFGKPCLLVPLPHGQRNEQLKNASFVKKTGIGEYYLQDSLTSKALVQHIESMLEHIMKYKTHADQARKLVRDSAAADIIEIAYEVAKKSP